MPATPSAETGADRELTIRMAAGLVVLVAMPFALVYAFLFATNTVGLALLEWLSGRPYHGQLYIDPAGLALVVLVGLAVQYRFGPQLVVSSLQARRPWDRSENPIDEVVTKLARQVDLPVPEVVVLEGEMPNAFAVGTPGNARLAVTTGLLETLDDDELEAVLAHELAHIKNRDASLMTVAWVVPTITYYLAVIASGVLSGLVRVLGAGTTARTRDGRAVAGAILAIGVTAVVTLAISVVFWLASVTLYRLLSRYREYAADRGAVAITGSPAALASALRTLDDELDEVPDTDLRRFDGGAEALYFAPLDASVFEDRALVSSDIFPSTHPPTADRIDRLQALAARQS